MEIGRVDGNTIENTRFKTGEQTARQVTKAAEQEGESRDVRTKAVSAPPSAGQAQGRTPKPSPRRQLPTRKRTTTRPL